MATSAARSRTHSVLLALVLAVVSVGLLPSAFLGPRRTVIAGRLAERPSGREVDPPCRRQASSHPGTEEVHGVEGSGEAPAPILVLQVPEANYFTTLAASHCLEEGCTVEEAEEIQRRLARDEERIEDFIRQLEGVPEDSTRTRGPEDTDWYNQFLESSRDLRAMLEPAIASIPFGVGFGEGATGGVLMVRRPLGTHQ